jgi:hypothetical protein
MPSTKIKIVKVKVLTFSRTITEKLISSSPKKTQLRLSEEAEINQVEK